MINDLFLEAVKASLTHQKVGWTEEIRLSQWQKLLRMAADQHILPMVFEAVYSCPSFRGTGQPLFGIYKSRVRQMVYTQAVQTSEFFRLYRHLLEAEVEPLVFKGLICRATYPQMDHRGSSDEDLLIPRKQFDRCHQAMLSFGMEAVPPGEGMDAAYEVSYQKAGSPLHIELHKELFPSDSDAYGDLNRLFEQVWDRRIQTCIQKTPVFTMGHSDHLLYLICHAFKHFLHSGFGIRLICDIVMYANSYGDAVDWDWLMEQCRAVHAEYFAAALFEVGRKYLNFDWERAHYPVPWQQIKVDCTGLVDDLLSGGIYGGMDLPRLHSSNMTLQAVAGKKRGKRSGGNVLKSVFLPARSLSGRYPYLKKYPVLLPVAWVDRALKYHAEMKRQCGKHGAAESIKIGNRRIQLLKEYHIL